MTTAVPDPASDDIIEGCRQLAAKHFKREAETLTPQTRFKEDLGADSLDLVLLVHDVEDRFKVTIAQEDLANVKTLGDAAAIVARSPRG